MVDVHKKPTGATTAITSRADRLKSWAAHHRRVSRSTLQELLANPVGSVMTWLVIGIALALPAILYVVLQNVSAVSGDWGGEPRISLYLEKSISVADSRALMANLNQLPLVQRTELTTAEEALAEFQHRSGFGEVLQTLESNPLPHVVDVVPDTTDPLALAELVERLEQDERVDRASVDLSWLERLFAMLRFAERLVGALSVVLALGVLLVMGNTIRLAIENRRQEIEIVKLVGGTDGFVRRPFLYLGFWYGLGGAVFAFLLLEASLLLLAGPVEVLAQSYRDDFALEGPGFTGSLLLLLGGAVLGVGGATIAVSRHLADIEPT